MVSTKLNKIVQSNMNLKLQPWMLSKNTNEIVNACVQKIYKQLPTSFNRDIKTVKVATPRPENKGPVSTLKHLHRKIPSVKITPRTAVVKKSNGKMKPNNILVNLLNTSNTNNTQMLSKSSTVSKSAVKTPNYKIYRSVHYSSNSSSSRSSLLRRFDERRRQRYSAPTEINYLIRSFHTSKLDPSYARCLMPARNQHLNSNLGSIPDAVKFSKDLLRDLMEIDRTSKSLNVTTSEQRIKEVPSDSLQQWNHPTALSTMQVRIPKESAIRKVSSNVKCRIERRNLSPQHREHAHLATERWSQFQHPWIQSQHGRNNTEMHEKHRRNRMIKLGLIQAAKCDEKQTGCSVGNMVSNGKSHFDGSQASQFLSEAKVMPKEKKNSIAGKKEICTLPKPSFSPLKTNSNLKRTTPKTSSAVLLQEYNTTSPLVAALSQMPTKNDLHSYRYHHFDFFTTKKY